VKNVKLSKFEFIELSDLGTDDDEPKWNVICQTVESKSHAAGDFVITLPMLHQAVQNFKLRSTGKIPIYFEHYGSLPTEKIDPEKGAPAQGHVIDMAVREDGRLWGLCRFYEPAKGYVKAGKYPFFSPGLFTDSLDRSTGKRVGMKLTEVSLVGNPHLYDMPEVCASNDERETPSLTAKNVPATSGATMTLEEALAEIKKLNDQLEVKALELKAANAKAAEAESNGKVALANKEREFAALKEEHEALVAVAVEERVEEAFKTYQKSHNLTDAHKPVMKRMLLSDREGFALTYPVKTAAAGTRAATANPNVPPYVLQDLTTPGGKRPPARTTQRKLGGPSEVAQIKARLLAENPKLSEDDAIVLAYEEAKSGKKEAVALWRRARTSSATRRSCRCSITPGWTFLSAVSSSSTLPSCWASHCPQTGRHRRRTTPSGSRPKSSTPGRGGAS
jgi:Mu-like prophage I protein